MLFFLDENIPAGVYEVLHRQGHEVKWTRDFLPLGSKDEVVARSAEINGAVLVSHDKDFKEIAPRIPKGARTTFRKLSMIRMECTKPQSPVRFATALPYIEFEFEQRRAMHDKRLIVAVKTSAITIYR